MKKLLFVMPSLYGGGAEKSLVNLLNLLDYSKYEIDLLLFKHEGLFLGQVPKEVNVLQTPTSLKYSFATLDKEALNNIEAVNWEPWSVWNITPFETPLRRTASRKVSIARKRSIRLPTRQAMTFLAYRSKMTQR